MIVSRTAATVGLGEGLSFAVPPDSRKALLLTDSRASTPIDNGTVVDDESEYICDEFSCHTSMIVLASGDCPLRLCVI